VNDYASVLSARERQALETLIEARERQTGAQMAIAIFRSLGGGNTEDFSIRLAERWRIGQKGLDNGVILVVFLEERRLRLEVGYGLEPTIPDIVAGQIIRDVIAPRFRENRYAAGLEAAVAAVYERIEKGPGAAPGDRAQPGLPWQMLGLLAVFVIIALVLGHEASRSRRFVSRRGYTTRRSGWGGPVFFPGPWMGGGRGGRGGGGGFSGGGGRFGGGGASGSW
jgi:uncharacterized protein